ARRGSCSARRTSVVATDSGTDKNAAHAPRSSFVALGSLPYGIHAAPQTLHKPPTTGRLVITVLHQCTPRISAAKAICSLLGCDSPRSAALSPLAAAESGNSSNAVLITTS